MSGRTGSACARSFGGGARADRVRLRVCALAVRRRKAFVTRCRSRFAWCRRCWRWRSHCAVRDRCWQRKMRFAARSMRGFVAVAACEPGTAEADGKQPALLTDAAWNPDELATLMMPFSGELLLVGGGRCGIRCYRRFPMWRSIRLWHPIRSWLRASVFRLWPREKPPIWPARCRRM